MQLEDHRILHHLDAPKRILYWCVEDALVAVTPLVAGIILNAFFTGFLASIVCSVVVKKLKRKTGGNLQAMVYWYLPLRDKKRMRAFPKSYKRTFVG